MSTNVRSSSSWLPTVRESTDNVTHGCVVWAGPRPSAISLVRLLPWEARFSRLVMMKCIQNALFAQQNRKITSKSNICKWDIGTVMKQESHDSQKYAMLILNQEITQRPDFMYSLWNNAHFRITVDGGTKKWDDFVNKMSPEQQTSVKPPHIVSGDFDSITDEMLRKYKNKGCKIVHTPDQDNTDFTKALIELDKRCKEDHVELQHVVAVCRAAGRLDHTLGNLHTLHLTHTPRLTSRVQVYLMCDDSLTWLLSAGEHVIAAPGGAGAWCSLVPLGEPCERVHTDGLKWNLDGRPLRFGDVISTSNACAAAEVRVRCSHALLWSMQIPALGP